MDNALMGPLLSFAFVVALIPLALWLLKRSPMGQAGSAHGLRVLASLSLGPAQRVALLEVGLGAERRWLVLGLGPQGIQTLHTLLPPDLGAPIVAPVVGHAVGHVVAPIVASASASSGATPGATPSASPTAPPGTAQLASQTPGSPLQQLLQGLTQLRRPAEPATPAPTALAHPQAVAAAPATLDHGR